MIATPIHLHREISISAMEKGFHVLLEKPPAVTIQDFDAMIQAQKASGVLCQVDFQNSSGTAFRLLIEKLKQGAMGNVEIVTGVGMWRRTDDYYASPTFGKKAKKRPKVSLLKPGSRENTGSCLENAKVVT